MYCSRCHSWDTTTTSVSVHEGVDGEGQSISFVLNCPHCKDKTLEIVPPDVVALIVTLVKSGVLRDSEENAK